MTDEQRQVIEQLRREGFAIAVFYPEEIEDLDRRDVENTMIVAVNDMIRVNDLEE